MGDGVEPVRLKLGGGIGTHVMRVVVVVVTVVVVVVVVVVVIVVVVVDGDFVDDVVVLLHGDDIELATRTVKLK